MATEINKYLIASRGASQVGEPLETSGMQGFAAFEIIVEATTADLVGEVIFTSGVELDANMPVMQNNMSNTDALPAGFVFQANPGGGQGHIRFGSTGTFPAVGRSATVIRISSGVRFVRPSFVFTSGAATNLVKVLAWGAIVGQQL